MRLRIATSTATAAVLALGLAACQTVKPEPEVRVVEKAVPTPVPCVPDQVPGGPAYPDTDAGLKAAPDAATRYRMIAAGRVLRDQRLAEVEPIIAACRKPPAGPTPP